VGYEYVNSDDCWMLAERGSNGEQVACVPPLSGAPLWARPNLGSPNALHPGSNPAKFPDGFKAVADAIHALGLKSGLYTAKGPNTCARFAASCDHEEQDAAQWAAWGIDYVKDDSCSSCAGKFGAPRKAHSAPPLK